MFGLPRWASALINLIAKLVGDWDTRAREAQANRDLGASQHAQESRAAAENQEATAAEVAARAADGPDDPRDMRD